MIFVQKYSTSERQMAEDKLCTLKSCVGVSNYMHTISSGDICKYAQYLHSGVYVFMLCSHKLQYTAAMSNNNKINRIKNQKIIETLKMLQ